jgi:transposase
MYLDIAFIRTSKSVHKRVLLRTSYREGKQVKHKTIANLSKCSVEDIEAIEFALKNKKWLCSPDTDFSGMQQGCSIGAVFALHTVATRLALTKSLGKSREAKLALWQVYARIIAQGSRLSAVRLAAQHAACEVLDLQAFDEDDLYDNLDWLSENQEEIENRLFFQKPHQEGNQLFLYDITSSYVEGDVNEYAEYGYNRDGKKGKKQIVIGLLTDVSGDPVSIQVFRGNTSDSTTVVDQINKCCERFKVVCATLVGDRGMIKGPQIKIFPEDFHYITSLTKPQITKLLSDGKIQVSDFCNDIVAIIDGNIRYILRRNPVRQQEIQRNREDKLSSIRKLMLEKNEYLKEHPKASVTTAIKHVEVKIKKLKMNKWIKCESYERQIMILQNDQALAEESELDGCYVIKTDVPVKISGSEPQTIHERYKDLAKVEWAFRTMKTTHLELRPHYVRKATRTEGHVFVIMLAYKLVRYLSEAWNCLNITPEEGIHTLGLTCLMHMKEIEKTAFVPQPNKLGQDLLKLIDVRLPPIVTTKGIVVATKKKLQSERLNR